MFIPHFDTSKALYCPKNAASSAVISELAYKGRRAAEVAAWGWGYKLEFFEAGDTQIIMLFNQSHIIIAPRGTDVSVEKGERSKSWLRWLIKLILKIDIDDIITDMKFTKTKGPFGSRVHRGFKEALDKVWDDLLLSVIMKTNRKHDFPVFITGHSLGAALGVLIAARLQDFGSRQYQVKGVYLFGCPKVGDADFARRFDTFVPSCWNIGNQNDIVNRIPPTAFFRYYSVGDRVYIDGLKNIHHNPSNEFIRSDRIAGRISELGKAGTDGTKDHFVAAYVSAMLGQVVEKKRGHDGT